MTLPVFIETDGACAGNEGKTSPGGWGAAIVQGNRILKRWGAKPDTSNNETEYMAMLGALHYTPSGAYIIIELDSQGCIDGITKYRKRWEKHGWRREDGKPVENAELIQFVCREVDRRHVGFRKVKGHNDDPWNDLADALAVKGRNQQDTEGTIQLIFSPVIDKKEQFVAFPRFSVSSHANTYDFWPRLVDKCGAQIGEPEDYEIWHDRRKLEGPIIVGLEYEIIARSTPGHLKPDLMRKVRRSSIDAGIPPVQLIEVKEKKKYTDELTPPTTISKAQASASPQFQAQVVYQAQDAP
jgi:ribonuclease HI